MTTHARGHAVRAALALALTAPLAAPALAQLAPPPGPVAPTQAREIFTLPFNITQSGSYRLGRDLTGAAAADFITVSAADVTIDFAGHTLDGGGLATYGVFIAATGDRVRIANGQITDTADDSINANFRAVVIEDMRLSNSTGGNGIAAANGKPVVARNVLVENVGFNGVAFSLGSTLENVTVSGAAGDGFNGNGESTLRACVAAGCGAIGFFCPSGAVLENCTADNNGDEGIVMGASSVVRACRAVGNGFGARARSLPDLPEAPSPDGVAGAVPHPFDGYADPVAIDRRTGAPLQGIVNLRRGGGQRTPTGGLDGIRVGADSLVVDCVSTGNFDDGIAAGARSSITDCTANDNDANGISAAEHCTISGCTASLNAANGIAAGVRSLLTRCTANANSGAGIMADDYSRAEGCTAGNNTLAGLMLDLSTSASGCEAMTNGGAGIQVQGNDCLISGCTARDNTGHGLEVGGSSGTRVESNHVCSNDGDGIHLAGTFALVVRNHVELDNINNASGSITNTIGPIIGSGADLTAVGPWANFDF